MTALGITLSRDGSARGSDPTAFGGRASAGPAWRRCRRIWRWRCSAAGQLEESIWGFSEALRLDPRSAQAQCGLGLAYQRLERWEEAAEAFRLTELLAPDQAVGALQSRPGAARARASTRRRAGRCCGRRRWLPTTARSRRPSPRCRSTARGESPAPVAHFSGDLGSFGLPEVLEFMRVQQKTGSLVLSSARARRRAPGAGPADQRLRPGRSATRRDLVSRGIISRADLEAALAIQRAAPADLGGAGERALRKRPGDRERLNQAVLQQIFDGLAEMLGWREGAFSFHPATPRSSPPSPSTRRAW